MKTTTKIAVIGGTGKSGKYLVKHLINQGISCKILIRNSGKLQINSSIVEVVEGDVTDYTSVRQLLAGCSAVISTLGFGQPPHGTSLFSQATTHIIRAMAECKIQRYIVITGLNVDTPFDKKSVQTKMATEWMYTHFPKTTLDKQREYEILATSTVNWTLVRLPLIEPTEERKQIQVSLEDCMGDKISATDLAIFLTHQLTADEYVKKAPFLANT